MMVHYCNYPGRKTIVILSGFIYNIFEIKRKKMLHFATSFVYIVERHGNER